jgi:DNA-binding transcriptional ArsR family regulator
MWVLQCLNVGPLANEGGSFINPWPLHALERLGKVREVVELVDYRPKIKLSQDEFRVLASTTRIDILKLLDQSQLTVSDVSRLLGMNKATVHEHLNKLVDVGLVKKEESPRKWVYYRLTWKGKNLLHPERVKVMVTLATIAVVILGGALLIGGFTGPLFDTDDGDGNGEPPLPPPSAVMVWEEGEDLVLKFESSSTSFSMGMVESLEAYIEDGPTEVSKDVPLELGWYREGDYIHLLSNVLEREFAGDKYLYVEVTVWSGETLLNFNLRKLIPTPEKTFDLRLTKPGIIFDDELWNITKLVQILFTVENVGTHDVEAVDVEVFSVLPRYIGKGFPEYGSKYLKDIFSQSISVPSNGSCAITFNVSKADLYGMGVIVFIDPNNVVPELDVQNNVESEPLPIRLQQEEKPAASDMMKEEAAPGFGIIPMLLALAAAMLMAAVFRRRAA